MEGIGRRRSAWRSGLSTSACHRLAWFLLLVATAFPASAARTYFNGFAGTWWNPSRDGEGLVISELAGDVAFVTWYTYDSSRPGMPVYLTGAALIADDLLAVDVVSTRGGRFGADFDPALVERVPWGRITLTLQSCTRMTLAYSGAAGATGTIQLERPLPLATPLCEPYPRLSGEVFAGTRRNSVLSQSSSSGCVQSTFNPDDATLTATAAGTQITIVLDNFFNGQCRFRGPFVRRDNTITGSGTYLCSEGLREGTWTLSDMRIGSKFAEMTIALTSIGGTCSQELRFRGVIPP